jgi:parvulin-like peptidyl-prolyl isomerase
MALLEQWRADVLAGKATMEALAKEHSDDPGVGTNGGLYEYYDPAKFVPEFSAAIGALKKAGDISPVVKTEYGYHLIQLVERIPERIPPYAEIREQLVEQARIKFVSDAQKAHIERLKTLPVEGSEESIAPLRSRYGEVKHKDAAAPAPESPAAASTEPPAKQ